MHREPATVATEIETTAIEMLKGENWEYYATAQLLTCAIE